MAEFMDMNALLSASQIAQYAGVSTAAVCNWAARGHLKVATDPEGREIRDSHGRPRYRLLDAAKAEHLMTQRQRGRRKAAA